MATLNDRVYDNGLGIFATEGTRLDICGTEPTTYTQATSTNSLGNKTSLSVGAPAARAGGGREVTVASFTNGNVTANGTAAYYAITDPTNSRLLATGQLSGSQAVTSGNTFSLSSFKIGIPAPA
jgi:hypothetical protein